MWWTIVSEIIKCDPKGNSSAKILHWTASNSVDISTAIFQVMNIYNLFNLVARVHHTPIRNQMIWRHTLDDFRSKTGIPHIIITYNFASIRHTIYIYIFIIPISTSIRRCDIHESMMCNYHSPVRNCFKTVSVNDELEYRSIPRDLVCWDDLTLMSARISNHIDSSVLEEDTYLFPYVNGWMDK